VPRRLSVLLGSGLLALALCSSASAAKVHVRVEGASATIFGTTEPTVQPVCGTFTPPSGPDVTVVADTALGALERASRRGEFYYTITSTSFGPYVSQIGRYAGAGSTGWVYKVNGISPLVGAHDYVLRDGDTVLWYFARFGPTGGPKSLHLKRKAGRCVEAVARDDTGARSAVSGVAFVVDGRRVARAGGTFCAKRKWHTLRAVKKGYVRSRTLVH
jgi:hypothetical protein